MCSILISTVWLLVCIEIVHLQACSPSVTKSSRLGNNFCSGQLIFEDNFDNLDLNKWQREITMAGGGNHEFQVYWDDPNNSFVTNGVLNIKPGKLADVRGEDFLTSGTLDLGSSCTFSWNDGCRRTGNSQHILPPITSARLHTIQSFSFTYGKVEVRAKMPAGDWIWPAIWLLPWQKKYGEWPASGEIDMVESRGNRQFNHNGAEIGVKRASSTMHWGPNYRENRYELTAYHRNINDGFDQDFHLYQLRWTPDEIEFSIDNVPVDKVTPPNGGFWQLGNFGNQNNIWSSGNKMAPFDQEFFLILNVAVGGTNGFFPDNAQNPTRKPWSNNSPNAALDFWNGRSSWESTWRNDGSTAMQVDYVKVWAL